MTRERAAQALVRMRAGIEDTLAYEQHSAKGYRSLYEDRDALQMGAEALMPWVRTADRRPTPKDADVAGFVLGGYWVDGEPEVSSYRWFWIAENPQSPPPFWMPIPPLPEVTE